MAKNCQNPRAPAGYGLSGPEPQGTGAFPWGGGSDENDPVNRVSREGGNTAATRRCSGPTTRLCTASIRPRQGMDVATGDPRGAARHGLTARCQHRWDYDEPYDVEVVDYH